MTKIQQLILQCFVIEPEDKKAFARARKSFLQNERRRNLPPGEALAIRRRRYAKEAEERALPENREAAALKSRKWREHNEERGRAKTQEWCEKNPERVKAYKAGYYQENKEKLLQESNARARDRRRTDPEFKLLGNLRTRIYTSLVRGSKSARTVALLGCTISEWRSHLESLFKPGMTWENYGSVWEVDHIRPCASFNLLDPSEQRACFLWSNTRPLFAKENHEKGAR